MTWRSWLGRVGSKRKRLAVRETAALGDRRFVSVIQFERQRFLIGSSPSSVTLLSPLPDEPASAEEAEVESRNKKESGEKN
jgi:flagellar biogenesis protein FliO